MASAKLPIMASRIDFFRCSSVLSCLLLSTKNGSTMGVVYFERGSEDILNSFSLLELRASLPWLVGESLGHRLFASCTTSSETQIGA